MTHRYRAVLAVILVPVLAAPVTPAPPETAASAEAACRAIDFAGCVKDERKEGSPIALLTIGACGSEQMVNPARHWNRLDESCRDRCGYFYDALQYAIAAQGDPLRAYQARARAVRAEMFQGFGGRPLAGAFDEELNARRKELEDANAEAQRRERDYEDCTCKCRQPKGGLLTGPMLIAGGGLATTLFAVLIAGGGGPANAPPVVPSVPPGVVPQDPSGFYGLAWRTIRNDQLSAERVQFQSVPEGQVTVNGNAFMLRGSLPLPTFMGTWDRASQQVTATGIGPVAGRPAVGVTLAGTLTPAGTLTAIVTVGEDGSLGGRLPHVVSYALDGAKLRP
jgi:hypothetical protein